MSVKIWTGENNGGHGTAFYRMGEHFSPLLENPATEPVISVLWTPWLDLGNDIDQMTAEDADDAARCALIEADAQIARSAEPADAERVLAMVGAIVAYRRALASADDGEVIAWVDRACAFLALAGAS